MSQLPPIGIKQIDSLDYYVHDLSRARSLLVDKLDFEEIGVSSPDVERRERQRGAVLRAGDCTIVLLSPTGEGGAAWQFLRRHPEGVGALTFAVEDAARAFALVEERGGTPITEVLRIEGKGEGEGEDQDDGTARAVFTLATPLGDTVFRLLERGGRPALPPGFIAPPVPSGGSNRFGFGALDHVTANFRTLAPAALWLEHVLGFERWWDVRFHTGDRAGDDAAGSGLKSRVMWDPASGVKLACNEPMRPHFRESQVARFTEDHRGDGVQHAALTSCDIISAVRGLRERGARFRPTPGAYYDDLRDRLSRLGVGSIDESVEALRELGILVDGSAPGRYLLQIFLEDPVSVHGDPEAGPFFFEIIERRGDDGFGAGNFRALFESIERDQRRRGG